MNPAEELDAVDHIAVTVADLPRSISWFTTSFGCELVRQDKSEAVLQFKNIKLVLVLPSKEPPHLAFKRADAEKFGELRRSSDGSRSTIISDPAGNVIELIAVEDR